LDNPIPENNLNVKYFRRPLYEVLEYAHSLLLEKELKFNFAGRKKGLLILHSNFRSIILLQFLASCHYIERYKMYYRIF